MKQTIEAKEYNLKRIFSDDYVFEIPPYQRPYSWTVEQTSELLDDLVMAMGEDGQVEETPPYFLGSIVLIKESEHAKAEVIDGQQRLTTLTILFCILRELSETGESKSDIDTYVCERGSRISGSKDRFRLSLRNRDNDFFRGHVQAPGNLQKFLERGDANLTDSQKRMYENAAYLWKNLSDKSAEKRERLAIFLVQRCYLVAVSASDESSAYRVFSVMNDRGLDLSPTDILKADIIGSMNEENRPKYTERWDEIEDTLGRDGFRELFTHIRMIYAKNKVQKTLNQEFKTHVLEKIKGQEFIDDVLTPYAEAYQVVSKAAYESADSPEKVNAHLDHLRRLDNFDWLPPAILYFDKFRGQEETLLRFVRDLERLAYFLFVTRANINERINRYASVLYAVEAGKDLHEGDFAGLNLQLLPQEKQDFLAALDGPIYLQKRVRLPLLLRLDSMFADRGATYEHKVVSIEHVLPQNPGENSEWLKLFPDSEIREEWMHKLANLVLLSRQKNSQAGNFDFACKKEEYFQKKNTAPFALTSKVLEKSEWTPAVLAERQKELIGKLKDEWRLE
ncbi:MAG: DUF262 domain-containing protein [Rhodospirillales bacterium]